MESQVKYILSLAAIRERAKLVENAAQVGQLNHFNFHRTQMNDVADFVTSIIKVGLKAPTSLRAIQGEKLRLAA